MAETDHDPRLPFLQVTVWEKKNGLGGELKCQLGFDYYQATRKEAHSRKKDQHQKKMV